MQQHPTLTGIPFNDAASIEKLYQYDILDTYAEDTFDRIAKLAASIFNAPNAIINFVDKDRIYFKANLSSEKQREIPGTDRLFSLPLLEGVPVVIEDTHEHVHLLESPLVKAPGGIRFYAAAPLVTPEGFKIGSICVVNDKPGTATADQLKFLDELSVIIIERLESRAAAKKAMKIQVEYMNRTIHDLRNAVASIIMASELIKTDRELSGVAELNDIVYRNSQLLRDRLNTVLDISRIEDENLSMNFEATSLNNLLNAVIDNFRILLKNKEQQVVTDYANDITVNIDVKKITEVFENLLSNAIKFSFRKTTIRISTSIKADTIKIGFHDTGQGLNETDKKNLFTKYAKMSSLPTGKEKSNGLGLSISKMLVALHNGNIYAESDGKNKGSSFYVSMPATPSHPISISAQPPCRQVLLS
ncbi:MAG: GAF domain-containing sensor histidine kinase [Chitinophagaceae bacterium]|nr:GAF domain-containing sensor histidine kinase [Chitinophagaceae bacterium]